MSGGAGWGEALLDGEREREKEKLSSAWRHMGIYSNGSDGANAAGCKFTVPKSNPPFAARLNLTPRLLQGSVQGSLYLQYFAGSPE
jgi:hypothetical protein